MGLKQNAALAVFAIAIAIVLATVAGCGRTADPAPRAGAPAEAVLVTDSVSVTPSRAGARGPHFGSDDVEQRLLDRVWIDAAEGALAKPTAVALPYAEWGGFLASEPDARSFAFAGNEGQIVKVTLGRPELNETSIFVDGDIRAELFLVQRAGGAVSHVRLAEVPAGQSSLWFRLPSSASYVVRLQPEPLTDALYRVSLELEAALPFPVRGRGGEAVRSAFGAERDGGKRHHEGIDIFAPQLTPVLAVADGRATPRETALGGHTVWLSTPGTSYYYAHLERVAVGSGQRVRAGEVIGYVGQSGNAATTEPHLHFGIYRWGQGAVDPFPLLQARRFTEPPRGLPDAQLVQVTLGRSCSPARYEHRAAASRGCTLWMAMDRMALERARVDASPADCAAPPRAPGLANDPADAFRWEAAAPLEVGSPAASIVPVALDFYPAEAVFEAFAPRAAGAASIACEAANADAIAGRDERSAPASRLAF